MDAPTGYGWTRRVDADELEYMRIARRRLRKQQEPNMRELRWILGLCVTAFLALMAYGAYVGQAAARAAL